MSIAEIKEILTGNFADAADRQYWLDKLSEAEAKEETNRESARYYKAMWKYAR